MRCIIFDLDGTLLDTSIGIFECIRYAADKLGYPPLTDEQLHTFIGPPLKVSFMRWYGCDEAEGERLTAAYREHYREGALFHARPYDGIHDLCARLKQEGYILAVATSKPQIYSEKILEHFGFDFQLIHGDDLAGSLSKADLIRLCVEESGADRCLMVGDTEHDAKGARDAGVPFLAVSYGFGNRELMDRYPRIGIADEPMDVLSYIGDLKL